jgi:hypothetical protein
MGKGFSTLFRDLGTSRVFSVFSAPQDTKRTTEIKSKTFRISQM